MHQLKQRWGIRSNFQIAIIFIVFAINGSASAKIGLFLMDCLGLTKEVLHPFLYYAIGALLILPIYPFLIMVTGWLFGQSDFFLKFGKKMINRMSFGRFFKE